MNQQDHIASANQTADNQRIPINGTSGYILTSLDSGWHATDWLDVNADIENVTNEDYRNHGSGQNEPGNNAIVGMKMSW